MSFESDDEDFERDGLGFGVEDADRKIRYEGEDTSPTTTRELNGWYAYPVAAEVFAVVAVGTSITPPNTSQSPYPKSLFIFVLIG